MKTDSIASRNRKFVNVYRNILIILTDGYLETGISEECFGNRCYDLRQPHIFAFRQAFKAQGTGMDMKSFFEKNQYGVIPVQNKALEQTEVLVLELYDRSLTTGGNSTMRPTDFEILKLFWDDWLTQSKVKRHEIYSTAASIHDVEKAIQTFMNIK